MQSKLSWGLVSVAVALIITACGSAPKYDDSDDLSDQDYQDYTDDSAEGGSNNVKHAIGNPAVMELWQQAETARAAGDLDGAVAQLERALRIAPDDAVMWSRLAEVRLSQGNANQAENLAAKSNAMIVDNPLLNYRNWLIIARARQLKGDDIGAQEAEYTANSFSQ